MSTLHLFAIRLDEVRAWFGAAPETAGRLRAVAAERFPTPIEPSTGTRLRHLGPLFKKSLEPLQPPIGPSPIDVENLVSGRAIPPNRLEPCWQIIDAWLEDAASQQVALELNTRELDDLDFELVRAGLPSQLSLQKLWGKDLGISLQLPPGLNAGYSNPEHVLETTSFLRDCANEIEQTSLTKIQPVLDFLTAIQSETEVIGLWWSD